MKRILLLVGASALLVAPFRAQTQSAQTQNDMTIPEFRQVLLDLGSYLDARKGTNLRSQFEAIPDDITRKLYPAVANPRRFQSAVAALKQHDSEAASGRLPSGPNMSAASLDPQAAFPSCPANTIIDTSVGAACTPAYPDSTNSAWRAMAGGADSSGLLLPGGDRIVQ